MRIITINASRKYDVVIGNGLLSTLGQETAKLGKAKKVAVISDSNVWPLHGQKTVYSLESSGFQVIRFVIPAGEFSKNGQTYLDLLNFLAEHQLTRSDMIVALGGGVVGDLTGFAAATFLRGIRFIQIPTTLLSAVDSSVGGKTAIDLPAGKNLVGAFKQPQLVLCDIDTLTSLPTDVFLDGCAEIIKYGVLYDPQLVQYLLQSGPAFDREFVIAKCVAFKRDVVQEDEFDRGSRQKLNFGHTIGHGIEAESNFSVTHGRAVAAGMAIATKAAVAHGFCDKEVYTVLCALLAKFSLPSDTKLCADNLYTSMLSDKKRSGNNITLIIPKKLGLCDCVSTPIAELHSFLKAGL